MRRSIAATDRIVTLIVAVALLALGVLGVLWWLERWLPLQEQVRTTTATDLMASWWWPYALAVLGVVLALLALRWLLAHFATSGIRQVSLPGSGKAGRLSVDVKSAASAAADALADTPGIRSARGTAVRQRGELVADIRTELEADADLSEVAAAADRVSSDLAHVLERPDIHCRVRVSVSKQQGGRRLS